MDAAQIAGMIASLLAPYIPKFGESLAEKAGQEIPAAVKGLWDTITAKFKGQPAADEAAKDLLAKPNDADNLAAFRKELRKALESDEDFAATIEDLLDADQHTGGTSHINVATVKAGDGGIIVTGNVRNVIQEQGTARLHGDQANLVKDLKEVHHMLHLVLTYHDQFRNAVDINHVPFEWNRIKQQVTDLESFLKGKGCFERPDVAGHTKMLSDLCSAWDNKVTTLSRLDELHQFNRDFSDQVLRFLDLVDRSLRYEVQ